MRAARRFVVETLDDHDPRIVDSATLMVSELATNCVQHAQAGFMLSIRSRPGPVRVEISDSGEGQPIERHPTSTEPTGRGLSIVDTLASKWGVLHRNGRKTVWFEIS